MASLNLTEEERNILEKFRERLQDLLKPRHDDRFLLRWLKARRFNLENAEKMLREDFKFRERYKSDTIVEEFQYPEHLMTYEPSKFLGFNKEGHCVRYFNLGSCDIKGFCKCISLFEIIRYLVYLEESDTKRMEENNLKNGFEANTSIILLDLKDIKPQQFYDRAVAKTIIHLIVTMQSHYPERLQTCILINASPVFYYPWGFLKRFIDSMVQTKIKLFGSDDYHDELFSLIPKEIIPAYVGGERYGPENDPYCNDLLNWKYPIPQSLYASASGLKKSDPGVCERVVKPFSSFELVLDVKDPGSTIHWDFQTSKNEIRFCLYYKEVENAVADNAREMILPFESLDCHLFPESGSYMCQRSGRYALLFDNSHSWFTSKKLLYKTKIQPPNDSFEVNIVA